MHSTPYFMRHIHCVGIGGIGMSGIAEILHNLGYTITGSDTRCNAHVLRLRSLGITIYTGIHHADHVGEANTVVVSTAVPKNNPEVLEAIKRHIPVIQRGEMLGELMRLKYGVAIAGTHGKTTTTSLMASVFDAGQLDATVINGGILNAYGTNARLGAGDWIIAEADESDGSFLKLSPTFAVVTNIDADHLDFYENMDSIEQAFCQFLDKIPFYGAAILGIDNPTVYKVFKHFTGLSTRDHPLTPKRILTYGLTEDAAIRACNIHPHIKDSRQGMRFDIRIAHPHTAIYTIHDVFIPLMGEHNIQNALATVAVALEVGISPHAILKGLENFEGVKRRFSHLGVHHGLTLIDDYAHHPVEVNATLKAAHSYVSTNPKMSGRIIAVLQPHRYSRLSHFLDDFADALRLCDIAIIAPVYEAGESAHDPRWNGISSQSLIDRLKHRGHTVYALNTCDDLAPLLHQYAIPGDLVVCMGAGSISTWAHDLPLALTQMAPTAYCANM